VTAQTLSVVVAAAAVAVSAVVQAVTIRVTRRNTLSTVRGSLFQAEATRLREAIAEHVTLTYKVMSGYSRAMREVLPWPGEYEETVEREDRLYNIIRLLLDLDRPDHQNILGHVDDLRAASSDNSNDRRDQLILAVGQVLRRDAIQAVD
jgi:hypothetical protein